MRYAVAGGLSPIPSAETERYSACRPATRTRGSPPGPASKSHLKHA